MRGVRRKTRIVLAAGVLILGCAAEARGFEQLPVGAQVNDDAPAGIDHEFAVGEGEPANSDVVGGTLSPSKPAVPWAIFEQNTKELFSLQIFVRSFAGGSWTTRGAGTIGGVSSAEPKFSGSLNFDQTSGAEAPAIDFAGSERTVPWAAWYEESTSFFGPEIFASRFDAAQDKWVFAGQGRGKGTGSVPIPSLNINPEQEAEDPSVAGGSLSEPSKPGPWITWQENQLYTEIIKEEGEEFEEEFEHHQIYVVRPQSPNKEGGQENCDGFKPAGEPEGEPAHVPAIGGLCWQQVGIARFPITEPEPTLNVDPTREGVEPDIAFTGKEDSVPWVVWYENGFSEVTGLSSHELVFAAKAVPDETADGHLHWVVVGRGGEGSLNNKGTHKLGGCAETLAKEEACSLNSNPSADAKDPRVAAGTMTHGKATVPWVAWDETVGSVREVFVARLNPESGRFELANGAAPISTSGVNSTRPDITFSGNTPYLSWREQVSPAARAGAVLWERRSSCSRTAARWACSQTPTNLKRRSRAGRAKSPARAPP